MARRVAHQICGLCVCIQAGGHAKGIGGLCIQTAMTRWRDNDTIETSENQTPPACLTSGRHLQHVMQSHMHHSAMLYSAMQTLKCWFRFKMLVSTATTTAGNTCPRALFLRLTFTASPTPYSGMIAVVQSPLQTTLPRAPNSTRCCHPVVTSLPGLEQDQPTTVDSFCCLSSCVTGM